MTTIICKCIIATALFGSIMNAGGGEELEVGDKCVLKAPDGRETWMLAHSANDAAFCTAASEHDIQIFCRVRMDVKSETLATYATGTTAVITAVAHDTVSSEDYYVMVALENGDSGWVTRALVELSPELHKARQVAADAEAARRKRITDAASARRKQITAEQRKRDAEHARAEAEREAAKQRKIEAVCAAIAQATSEKKVKDLTVREEQQVRACQTLGLY